jgi:hypothetical protein
LKRLSIVVVMMATAILSHVILVAVPGHADDRATLGEALVVVLRREDRDTALGVRTAG